MSDRWSRIGWDDMFRQFMQEFNDGCAAMRNQLRWDSYYTTDQANKYYQKHGCRMLRERYGRKEESK